MVIDSIIRRRIMETAVPFVNHSVISQKKFFKGKSLDGQAGDISAGIAKLWFIYAPQVTINCFPLNSNKLMYITFEKFSFTNLVII